VLASSETLGEALGRAARYSSIVNEGFRVTVREGREIDLVLENRCLARVRSRFTLALERPRLVVQNEQLIGARSQTGCPN